MAKVLHAVEFDGTTFGMEIDANTAAYRRFKKAVVWEKCVSRFGGEVHHFVVPYLALGAIMQDAHLLVTENKEFDRIRIEEFLDSAVIYVKYTDEPIDFRNRQAFRKI